MCGVHVFREILFYLCLMRAGLLTLLIPHMFVSGLIDYDTS